VLPRRGRGVERGRVGSAGGAGGQSLIKPGEEWGEPTAEAPDAVVRGDDAALAAVVPAEAGPVPLVRFFPQGSELARAVGLAAPADAEPGGIALPVDAIVTDHGTAVNLVVLGPAPTALRAWHHPRQLCVTVDGRTIHDGPATTVVIANGQFSGHADLVPRGHPGDGRLEVQVYALRAGERGAMRRRLATGSHLPHPRILAASGRTVAVTSGGARLAVTVDGRPAGHVPELHASVRHPALRLLI
jgi:hypothetical protein